MKKAVVLPAQCVLGAFVAALSATPCLAEDPPAFTGHIDLVSKYILRGASTTYGNALPGLGNEFADAPESDQPVLQWGVDYVHPSGWYVGYWGSRINYSYKRGITGYVYYNGKHANAFETKVGVGYKEFGLNAQTLLQDTVWGNKGDT